MISRDITGRALLHPFPGPESVIRFIAFRAYHFRLSSRLSGPCMVLYQPQLVFLLKYHLSEKLWSDILSAVITLYVPFFLICLGVFFVDSVFYDCGVSNMKVRGFF